ncbi:ankyrin repeat-containing domain protein [Microdochium trichocladiopsis]|uniref:Ankyrin repeat-containing domain protein n=1 Tax=Microdochium trichocladiopsis TaxID=1682393 RepID=A0A9P8Y2P1_9PEZI|nr:ankyrin repeat-containing domain protein [Microdochium trichocladiopsis]KAH7027359.1 ankyrin repeat-containing domain protein [Microdochium trichocladiopsis]
MEELQLLVNHGANINQKVAADAETPTPLMRAAKHGRYDFVKYLLANSVDASTKNEKGDDALMLALLNHHKRCAEALLNHGVSTGGNSLSTQSSITVAIKAKWFKIATKLIIRGADLEIQDEQSWTPLMHAVAIGNLHTVKMLVDKGAFLNAAGVNAEQDGANEDKSQETALNIAIRKGFYDIAALLLTSGSSVTLATDMNPDLSRHGYVPVLAAE